MSTAEAPPSPPAIRAGELISAAGALLLIPIMFALQWYGVVGLPRPTRSGITTAENAWAALTTLRWLMVVTIAAAIGSVVLHVSQRSHGTKTDTGVPVAVLGTLTAALLCYRVLVDLPDPSSVVDIKLGAFLGLLCAIAIALGGFASMREDRARREAFKQRSRPRLESDPAGR